MDLRKFYQKLREAEQAIVEAFPVVVSHETPDGGRAGQTVEVSRAIAARLVVEGKGHVAVGEELAAHNDAVAQALQEAQKKAMAEKIQIKVVSDADFRSMPNPGQVEKR
jgi:uncharacterized Fe-S cluster-containing radical SAM superfamily enzyme